jgi:hemerythrin-like domain-containing protein
VSIQLADILEDLRQDHRNMSVMLDLLEREIGRVRDGRGPDYELINDIMRYLTVYSDAVHHPKEDILYRAMQDAHPDLAAGLEHVEPEHRKLAELGVTLRIGIEAIAADAPVSRSRIVANTGKYVDYLRRHMDWEERDLFPRAEALIKAETAMFVDISHLDKLDPVFGPEREHSFANLLHNIQDFSGS